VTEAAAERGRRKKFDGTSPLAASVVALLRFARVPSNDRGASSQSTTPAAICNVPEATAAVSAEISQLSARDLAVTAWALSKLRVRDIPLQNSISRMSLDVIGDSQATDLAKMAWACARQSYRDCPLLAGIAQAAPPTLLSATAQELSSLAQNSAKALLVGWALPATIQAAGMTRASEFHGQTMANTVWALAKMLIQNEDFMAVSSARSL